MTRTAIEQTYQLARERYAALGVDTDAALAVLAAVPISLHCWQGDDVGGFESEGSIEGSGLQVTGGYPGKARTAGELRADMEQAFRLVPGTHRVNLHAIYAETGGVPVDRNALTVEHFATWIDWARAQGLGLDFNGSFFSHPLAASGLTLSHPDPAIRQFWVEHGIACRRIGAAMGEALGTPAVVNVWIPDGYKDLPADRKAPRERLRASLDAIFADVLPATAVVDAVESKLFGIGSESYVVGSHEFYMGYALQHRKCLCLDSGHFHPTEGIADKLSSVLLFLDEVLLHVSRGVRWDSDHVVILSDELRSVAEELVRGDFLSRVHIGLDYFDASINRVAAWVIGLRSMQKALLLALLEPGDSLRATEAAGDYTGRLAMLEELKSLPFGAVWDFCCLQHEVPVGPAWIDEVRGYEARVLTARA
jgi:L-rhamnose isomerase